MGFSVMVEMLNIRATRKRQPECGASPKRIDGECHFVVHISLGSTPSIGSDFLESYLTLYGAA